MKNKQLKKQLITNGTFEEYSKQRFNMFEYHEYDKLDNYANYFDKQGEQFDELTFECCQELKEARKKQRAKIREHYTYWLKNNYQIYFCTFTYRDEYNANNLSAEQLARKLKRKIIRTISNNCDDYIINIDYGSKNERLHYHALIAFKYQKNDMTFKEVKREKVNSHNEHFWKKGEKLITPYFEDYEKSVGFYDAELCRDDEESAIMLSRYVDKLTLHSIKIKQSYIATKKGSDYQRELELTDVYMKEMQKAKREKKTKQLLIDNNFYLDNLRQNKRLLRIEQFCDMEYRCLLQKQRENEFKLRHIERLKTLKKDTVFDLNLV